MVQTPGRYNVAGVIIWLVLTSVRVRSDGKVHGSAVTSRRGTTECARWDSNPQSVGGGRFLDGCVCQFHHGRRFGRPGRHRASAPAFSAARCGNFRGIAISERPTCLRSAARVERGVSGPSAIYPPRLRRGRSVSSYQGCIATTSLPEGSTESLLQGCGGRRASAPPPWGLG